MTPHTLVTGPPRCGTGYLAKVLTDSGLNAGHEAWWGIEPQQEVDIDVSWLGCFDTGFDGNLYGQIRHPLNAIPSIAAAYNKHPWRLVLAQNVELTGDPTTDACRIWTVYTAYTVERTEHWWRVEDLTADDLAWTGVDCGQALAETPKDTNTRPAEPFTWGCNNAVHEALSLGRELGYAI